MAPKEDRAAAIAAAKAVVAAQTEAEKAATKVAKLQKALDSYPTRLQRKRDELDKLNKQISEYETKRIQIQQTCSKSRRNLKRSIKKTS